MSGADLEAGDWLDEAHARLQAWGAEDWRQRTALGYARQTLEKVMCEHGFVPRATGAFAERLAPEVIEIDEIVSMLAAQRGGDRERLALWLYYAPRKIETELQRASAGDSQPVRLDYEAGRLTARECATAMRCSRIRFRSLREAGVRWVAGALSRGPRAGI